MNTKPTTLIEYYKDQVSFYSNRMKRAEKHIADLKRIGLPVTELHLAVFEDEKENVERYKAKLEKVSK